MVNVQKYELLVTATIAACGGLLNGLGKTKIIMVFHMLRAFIIRIPLLFYFYYVLHFNYLTPAYVLVISNSVAAILILIVTLVYIYKFKKNKIKLPKSIAELKIVETPLENLN